MAILAFVLIVVAGADLQASGTGSCAGWGNCSGWTHLTTSSGSLSQLHLAVAGLTGLMTIALVGLSWFRLRDDHRVMRAAMVALALICVQVVAVLLPSGTTSAAWGAAIHLAGTALLLALALYLITLPIVHKFRATSVSSFVHSTGRYRALR